MNAKNQSPLTAFRWLARIPCLISIGILSLFAFGGEETLEFQNQSEVLGFLLFPVGIVIGMLLAWRWEIIGGTVTLLSLIGFYVWHFSVAGKMASGPYFLLFALPGLALLLIGLASRSIQRRRLNPRLPANR